MLAREHQDIARGRQHFTLLPFVAQGGQVPRPGVPLQMEALIFQGVRADPSARGRTLGSARNQAIGPIAGGGDFLSSELDRFSRGRRARARRTDNPEGHRPPIRIFQSQPAGSGGNAGRDAGTPGGHTSRHTCMAQLAARHR